MDSTETRLSKPIQSLAISQLGDRAVALVRHDHVYYLDLSGKVDLTQTHCWIVPRPAIEGNRLLEIRDSAIVYAGKEQVCLCHITGWKSDPTNQISIQQLNLRTGEISYECNVPWQASFQCSAILLSDDLLLVGCQEDAVLVQLSKSEVVCTLRESLFESEMWESDDEKPWKDDVMPKQGLVLDPETGTVHALFDGEDKAFVESYRWNKREDGFNFVKRQTISAPEAGALCVGPRGVLGVWMTNRGEDIPIPPGGVEAIKDAELGRMVFLSRDRRGEVEVRSGEDNDFDMLIMQAASKSDPDILRIGTAQAPAFPVFSSDISVLLNTPAGRLLCIDKSGSVEELHRCRRPLTAAAWSPSTGRLFLGSGANGTLTFLQLDPLKTVAKASPKPKISKKKGAARMKKPANLRRAEKRIRDEVAEGGDAVFLSGMQLTEFPELLFETTSWERLGFYSNRIADLPERIATFRRLRQIQGGSNALRALPNWIGELCELRDVELSYNEITELPESFGQLKKLTELDLSYNPLVRLPESFGNLKKLRRARLHHCQLTSLPDSFGNLSQLRDLELHDCPLGEMPPQLQSLVKLTSLELSNAGIREIPHWIGNLTQIKSLYIDNPVSKLPASIRAMTKLQTLSLCYSDLTTVPDWLSEMKSLRDLYLSQSTKLVGLPESVRNINCIEIHGTPFSEEVGWTTSPWRRY
jgi:hypothetical protein